MYQKDDKIYIIAEIGGNFTDYKTAVNLVNQAKESGVDAIKLQSYRADTISSKNAMFDMENTGVTSQMEYFKKLELSEELHRKVFAYAREQGLDIFSTPSHANDVEMLERLNVDVYKLGADDATNLPFLKYIARLNKPMILSTGMCTLEEVKEAVNAVLEEGNDKIVIMHVVSLYPTAPQYVNLETITTLQKEFPQFVIGYSDHTIGIDSCIFAAVMGAKVIEKHFTYDKYADGPDHLLSATQEEMHMLVKKIRLYELMKGNGIKMPVADEIKNRKNNRKSIICTKNLCKGDVLSFDNLDIKRPGTGITPKNLNMILGKKVTRDIKEDSLLQWGDFE
ncbi:MAG TPA: N-acylneuraminate-9-phosphate synthase [Lachnospiraceae bacterium]|nr:N-acylneuraminate-9-phosphate synthase [Lachnospiraceae bacterium]